MAFLAPAFSRGSVDRAGQHIRDAVASSEDLAVLENWRAAHLYVINTFQASLRARRRRLASDVVIAQRLKRRPTIVDKLSREPGMYLSRMHDIAGCRIIFDDITELRSFRAGVHTSRASHELIGGDDRYDYILSPKSSGYRGVHDVFKYVSGTKSGEKWNGLRIEIQYRTRVQHAWATAVEISDIVNSTRLKFSEGQRELTRLFCVASELLSRAHEDMPGCCGSSTIAELLTEFTDLEARTRTIERLSGLAASAFTEFASSYKLFILVNFTGVDSNIPFQAFGFSDNRSAVERYNELEKEFSGRADVVLVGSSEQDAVKLAYTNYFSDASMFVALLMSALERFGVKLDFH